MNDRLDVLKTYKLFIGGAFPRTESGRSEPIIASDGRVLGHSCKASRKDLREAVVAARKALPAWSGATAYNRGQILYRMAEMLEGKRAEVAGLLESVRANSGGSAAGLSPQREVELAVDRLVAFAGWSDKFAQVLGSQNPVAGPYWNISTPEPTGVIGVVPGAAEPALLAMVTLAAPALCVGNCVLIITQANPAVASVLGEVMATSDLPAGAANILTGSLDELVPVLAGHRDVDGIHAGAVGGELSKAIGAGVAENLKRVKIRPKIDHADASACHGPSWIEPFVEFKTVWHPVGA
jgi:acyl-CoA reductase-like NAD-dependent aldehyde dehydrogenase